MTTTSPGPGRNPTADRVRRRPAAAHRRAHRPSRARLRAEPPGTSGCGSGSPAAPTDTPAGSARPDTIHSHRLAPRPRALPSPGHRLPLRPRQAPVPSGGRQAIDADAARPLLHRRGAGALPSAAGGPFALATSARSYVLQEFEGGPGQIALHGTNDLSGALGSAASHGCIGSAPSHHLAGARTGRGVRSPSRGSGGSVCSSVACWSGIRRDGARGWGSPEGRGGRLGRRDSATRARREETPACGRCCVRACARFRR